jgi:hypothetical protein
MAERVEIDIPGIGRIEAKNAASEATLLEILKALQTIDKRIAKGISGAGGGKSAKELEKELKNLNKEVKDLNDNIDDVNDALEEEEKKRKKANEMLGAFAGALTGLVVQAVDLMGELAGVGNSLSSASRVFNNFGAVGRVAASVFSTVAGAAESQLKSYQELSSIGASFGGSMNDMTRAASAAGLTVSDFANVVKNNAEAMRLLGGTTEAGAKRFADLGRTMRQSGLQDELLRMGYSTEQINSGMAGYISIIGKTGALQNMTTQQIAASSAGYLKDLDALAKITGQTREEKQKEQDALMKDAQVRAAMAGMDAEAQKQMMAYITSFPKEQQAAIKDMIATGTITSEEALKLNALMPGAAAQAMEFGRTLQAGGKISRDSMNAAKNNAIVEAKTNTLRYKEQGLFNKEMAETYVGMAELASQEVDGMAKAYKQAAQTAEQQNLAETLEQSKQKLAEFSNFFVNFLAQSGLIDVMMKAFEVVASLMQNVVAPVFQVLADGVAVVTNFITENFTPVMIALAAGAMAYLPALKAQTVAAWSNVKAMAASAKAAFLAALPFIKIAAPVLLLGVIFKKAGGDLEVLGDAAGWVGSWVKTSFLQLFRGLLWVLNKIPGLRGDFNDAIANIDGQLTEETDKRARLEKNMGDRMKKNQEEAKARDKERHKTEMNHLDEKRDVDLSTPEAMLRSFREQQLGKPSASGTPSSPTGRPIQTDGKLGFMAAKYESGNKGSEAVGWDSTGGTSYGKYQIATKTGTMDKFLEHLKKENPEAYERLTAAGPADSGKDGAFAQEWKKLASEGKLQKSEHDFIKATHFDKGVGGIKDDGLKKMLEQSKALQEVMWSTSVQHGGGGASGIFNKTFKEGMSEEDLIKAIYAERGTRFGSSTQQVRSSVQARFADEQQQALGMVGMPVNAAVASTPSAESAREAMTGEQKQAGGRGRGRGRSGQTEDAQQESSDPYAQMAEGTTKTAASDQQKSSMELLDSLNNKMDALISVSARIADLNDRQLSVQKDLGSTPGLMVAAA